MTVKVGVVGYGYWGPNLVRNFLEVPGAELVAVCDLSADRLATVKKRYPSVRTTTDYRDLLRNGGVDAVVIATPVTSHYKLASEALREGKHVLVEKPMTASTEEARRLVDEAETANRVLFVDHTFVYTGAVRKIGELVSSGEIGDVLYFDSTRVNLGLFQHDVNVIWDLAVHDLSIMDFVVRAKPTAVSATGISHVSGQPENTAYLTLFFDAPVIAHFHMNWLAPVKVRRTLVCGSRKMIVYDDLEASEKVKVYDKGIALNQDPTSVYQMKIGYRTGDMWAPQLSLAEALQTEAREFVRCVETGARPATDGAAGLRVVRTLEAANESLRQKGKMVELSLEEALL
jgi:predicted dehydrogenase